MPKQNIWRMSSVSFYLHYQSSAVQSSYSTTSYFKPVEWSCCLSDSSKLISNKWDSSTMSPSILPVMYPGSGFMNSGGRGPSPPVRGRGLPAHTRGFRPVNTWGHVKVWLWSGPGRKFQHRRNGTGTAALCGPQCAWPAGVLRSGLRSSHVTQVHGGTTQSRGGGRLKVEIPQCTYSVYSLKLLTVLSCKFQVLLLLSKSLLYFLLFCTCTYWLHWKLGFQIQNI